MSANRTKPGLSFQLQKWPFVGCAILVLSVKLPDLKLKAWLKQLLGFLLLVNVLPRPSLPTSNISGILQPNLGPYIMP